MSINNSLLSAINPFAHAEASKRDENKTIDNVQVEKGTSFFHTRCWRKLTTIPSKILYWNSKYASGNVSDETIQALRRYLDEEGLHDTCIAVEQYKPQREWSRVMHNPKTSTLAKYTIGVWDALAETFLPSKYFAGDHYAPQSNTIYLNSDDPSLAIRMGGYAKDYNSRKNPSLYELVDKIPSTIFVSSTSKALLAPAILSGGVSLWKEGCADASAIYSQKGDNRRRALATLIPVFGGIFATIVVSNAASLAVQNSGSDLNPTLLDLGISVAVVGGAHLIGQALARLTYRSKIENV